MVDAPEKQVRTAKFENIVCILIIYYDRGTAHCAPTD
jgi:hypothetical protein